MDRVVNKQSVFTLREEHPDWTLDAIGKEVGVTRERVRQILKKKGMPTKSTRIPKVCSVCGIRVETSRKFCSSECRKKNSSITFKCSFCNVDVTWAKSVFNAQKRRGYKNIHCSRECSIRHVWKIRHDEMDLISNS
jgi:hypothetical protein